MLQCDKLQKKQKLAIIQSEIETLQVIKMTKKSHWAFTWTLTKNLNDLCIIFIMSTMTKQSHHKIVSQKRRFSMYLKKYHDKIIREHKEWIKETLIQSWRDYVCSLADVIWFYQLSSESNQELNESRHKHDSAVCECIATFWSNDMNVCSSFEHSETLTFIV